MTAWPAESSSVSAEERGPRAVPATSLPSAETQVAPPTWQANDLSNALPGLRRNGEQSLPDASTPGHRMQPGSLSVRLTPGDQAHGSRDPWRQSTGQPTIFQDPNQPGYLPFGAQPLAPELNMLYDHHFAGAETAEGEAGGLDFDLMPDASSYSHMVGMMEANGVHIDPLASTASSDHHGQHYDHLVPAGMADLLRHANAPVPHDFPYLLGGMPMSVLPSESSNDTPNSDDWQGEKADAQDFYSYGIDGDADQQGSKKKVARRQGVTCDQCRSKHLRCDLDDRRASLSDEDLASAVVPRRASSGSITQLVHTIKCSRCEEKGFVCTKTHAPPSRRYPRPSRTGKRIEQARLMHGTSGASEAASKPIVVSRTNASTILLNALVELRGAEIRINDRVMAGSLSLQLLNCFFAIAHMQTPVVDFEHFSRTFNASNGDPRKMSIMSNGGSKDEGLPAALPPVMALDGPYWPGTKESKIATPGTTETLIAVMHAWAAHYTDVPIAFGTEAKELELQSAKLSEVVGDQEIASHGSEPAPSDHKGTQRRPKRKQGVACDTCRLRRVRCDLTERPEGLGCSRCEDKKIKCTDAYIQAKKTKSNVGAKTKGPSASPSADATVAEGQIESGDSGRTENPEKLSPRQWISNKRQSIMRAYIPGDTAYNLRRGKARKAFCHALLNHALSLVHKHDLLSKPSVEAAQALTLLTPLMDSVDADQAFTIADTACSHLVSLGIVTRHVVNESDQVAVEGLFAGMQRTRLYLTTWCRDAVSSGLNRRRPFFKDERAIEVVSGSAGDGASRCGSVANQGVVETLSAGREAPTLRNGEVVLSGEMGLTFVFMAQIQIGALSRFIAVHIDRVETSTPSVPSWQRPAGFSRVPSPEPPRFASRPSLAEVQRLEKACNAVWSSIDSLMQFFDRCAAKARQSMDKVKPFRPLGWIASTKISGSLLYLTVIRVLGERFRTNAGYMAAMAQAHGHANIPDEDKEVAQVLKSLFDRGMQKTLSSCRRTSRLVEVLLPLGLFQTGGLLQKQIFPVAQFLAKVPSIPDVAIHAFDLQNRRASQTSSLSLPGQSFVDPRSLSQKPLSPSASSFCSPDARASTPDTVFGASSTSQRSQASDKIGAKMSTASGGETLSPNDPFEATDPISRTEMGPFTHSAKLREVEACIEGLSQLGYAWDTMDREIEAIRGILDTFGLG